MCVCVCVCVHVCVCVCGVCVEGGRGACHVCTCVHAHVSAYTFAN